MGVGTVTTNALDHLQQKWSECYRENKALQQEIERLKTEMTEIQRKQKIALDNAYENGYEAGRADAMKRRP